MSPNPAVLTWPRAILAGTSYYDEVMADNPTAFWTMDSGSVLMDQTGNYPGTFYENCPPIAPFDPKGELAARNFPAPSHFFQVPHDPIFNIATANPFSIEVFARLDPSADQIVFFADKSAGSGSQGQWGVWWDNRSSQGSQRLLRFFTGTHNIQASSSFINDAMAEGALITVTRGYPSIWKRIYVNGVEVTAQTASHGWNSNNILPIRNKFQNDPINYDSGPVSFYKGTALTPERVVAHAQAAGVA